MFRLLRSSHSVVAAVSRYTSLTKRMSSSLLIENKKYSFLKELGLDKDNVGVFYGQWEANGEVDDGS